jgi:hypothetical protein
MADLYFLKLNVFRFISVALLVSSTTLSAQTGSPGDPPPPPDIGPPSEPSIPVPSKGPKHFKVPVGPVAPVSPTSLPQRPITEAKTLAQKRSELDKGRTK